MEDLQKQLEELKISNQKLEGLSGDQMKVIDNMNKEIKQKQMFSENSTNF